MTPQGHHTRGEDADHQLQEAAGPLQAFTADHVFRPEGQLVSKSLQKVIAVHKLEEIKAIFELVKNKHTKRRRPLDTVKMAKTNPAVRFFKKLIMADKLHIVEMSEVSITLPRNFEVPSVHMIERTFEMIKHPNVVTHKTLKHNAHIAWATILNWDCFNKHHSKTVFQSISVARCAPQNSPTVTEYIPHLKAELEAANQEKVHAAIPDLETIGVLPILLPYREGKAIPHVAHRKMSFYDLTGVTHKYRGTFLPIYSAFVFNQGENRKLKIAALAAMIPMEPHMVHLQKLSVST